MMNGLQKMPNKANSLGRQKAPLVPRSAFLSPVICDVMHLG